MRSGLDILATSPLRFRLTGTYVMLSMVVMVNRVVMVMLVKRVTMMVMMMLKPKEVNELVTTKLKPSVG